MTGLLRFRDLEEYGVNNWPTLGRWIKDEGFPTGFYLAANTRAWPKEDCDNWLPAGPRRPPDIKQRPAPKDAAKGNGPRDASAGRQSNPTDKRIRIRSRKPP